MRRWGLLFGALAAVAILIGVIGIGGRQARLRAVAENTVRAETLKGSLGRRFPPAALEADVVAVLKKEHPGYLSWPLGAATEYGVPVGQEPSDVWYCGSWTRGVKLRFEAGRLVSTSVDRWSNDCM